MKHLKVILFLLLVVLISCSDKAEKNIQPEKKIVKTEKTKKKASSKFKIINSLEFLEKNLESCIKDYELVESKNKHKNWASADYDFDGIKEIAGLFQIQNAIKLIIIDRDKDGNCTKEYSSQDLTKKLIGKDQYVQVQSRRSTRLAEPGTVTNHISFSFESSAYNLVLTFYYNSELNDYCLLTSDYIINENDQYKEGQIIAKDYLSNERKVMSKSGSRENMLKEKFEAKPVRLSSLDFAALQKVVK